MPASQLSGVIWAAQYPLQCIIVHTNCKSHSLQPLHHRIEMSNCGEVFPISRIIYWLLCRQGVVSNSAASWFHEGPLKWGYTWFGCHQHPSQLYSMMFSVVVLYGCTLSRFFWTFPVHLVPLPSACGRALAWPFYILSGVRRRSLETGTNLRKHCKCQ